MEFNASRRALQILSEGGILTNEEVPQARKVLTAAALTYVAAAVSVLLQLLRLFLLFGGVADARKIPPLECFYLFYHVIIGL